MAAKLQIPVKTYREWTSYLFDSIPNSFVNIFPSIGVDLDSNNIPDGFLNATFLDNSDGVVSSGNKCFSRNSTGTICEVQNLADWKRVIIFLEYIPRGVQAIRFWLKLLFPK
jgi:hypothetical protein